MPASHRKTKPLGDPGHLTHDFHRALTTGVDLALPAWRERWLPGPHWGGVSYDNFTRLPNNPIHRGSSPLNWPVNGFLFIDPPTGHWYVYAGCYPTNYALLPPPGNMQCLLYRSIDRGNTWDRLGPVLPQPGFWMNAEGERVWATHAPDVSVVFDNGKYHMLFDWAVGEGDFGVVAGHSKPSGMAYAVAQKPEGPFLPSERPTLLNASPKKSNHLGKYHRYYAGSFLKRANDWIMFVMLDSGPALAWGLAASTATDPAGPWRKPELILSPEGDDYYPHIVEFFPAFAHDGIAYCPATGIATTRDYQAIWAAPLEQAHLPAAWELIHDGSAWHSQSAENETWGIWGQTFSAQVAGNDLIAMFPSRDAAGNGAINIAQRPLAKPFRDRGFALSGGTGSNCGILRDTIQLQELTMNFKSSGQCAVFWDAQVVLGAGDNPLEPPPPDCRQGPLPALGKDALVATAVGLIHAKIFRWNSGEWELARIADGSATVIAKGVAAAKDAASLAVRQMDGKTAIAFNDLEVWAGSDENSNGMIGVLCSAGGWMEAEKFSIRGNPVAGSYFLASGEAQIHAGEVATGRWQNVSEKEFHFGHGALSTAAGARGKWNLRGSVGCRIWAPLGPGCGSLRIRIDGRDAGTINLNATVPAPSAPRMAIELSPDERHTVVLEAEAANVPLDVLEVLTSEK